VGVICGSRLVEIAPHYFDLSNFPKGEARRELERLYMMQAHAESQKKKKEAEKKK
jgi:pre-mRNA-splicing factor ATP-dependent RNA helicase DHX15/PRP43